eukprot:CAMPEP_0194131022 /NCGR_PEP_ID=MMETSP0152-20130528/1881_1 /TAXON_ID=1049557 /ORGANISM="Thalassiothrix antarctica, Strain L6-D1" /LENGTH=186 /DNA_ID=CAMNT_0038825673 /DNA_START=113 /DNA_END=670 /DNA_ORIENTATION=+
MSEARYCQAGDGEDDILESRTAPFPLRISDSSKSSMSMLSNGTANKGHDAILLSDATNQATSAAYSVLSAGGTESTALNTAKAVAASVLRTDFEKRNGLIGNGQKEWFYKRRIKKQADILASMSLVAAANTMRQQEAPCKLEIDIVTERDEKSISSDSTAQTSQVSVAQKLRCFRDDGVSVIWSEW